MAKQTVLISGGSGFVGSHLADAYLAKGYAVVAVDNLSTSSKDNVEHLLSNSDFTFVEHDICDPLPPEVMDRSYTIVANLASPASPPHYQRLALETLLVGSVGLQNMLEVAKRDSARFFQASTSEVYGDPDVHPQPEAYKGSVNCYGPRSMYDEAKRFGEAMIYVYHNQKGVNTTIARFFNTYGPRMDANDGRVVSNFIIQALKNEPLTVYGKGDQTRSFCYIDDLIAGIITLTESAEEGPMNLGNPGEFTILELAHLVKELTGSTSEIVYKPLPGDDPMQRKPVIDLATAKLGWKPTIALRDGLVKTIEYFKSRI